MVSFKKTVSAEKAHDSGFDSSNTLETTTSTTYVDYAAVDTAITTDGSKVLVNVTYRITSTSADIQLFTRISRDDVTAVSEEMGSWIETASDQHNGSITWIDTPGSGAHTYELQHRTTNGAKNSKLDLVSLSAVELKNAD